MRESVVLSPVQAVTAGHIVGPALDGFGGSADSEDTDHRFDMKTHVEFRSDRFPPYPGEDEEVNPGIWGKRLALFLAMGLKKYGIQTDDVSAEDWGWMVPIENDAFPLWIGSANYEEYPDGFLCFVEPSKPFVRRLFRKISTEAQVSAVTTALHSLLSSEPSIRDVRWWTAKEFNHPSGGKGAGDYAP